MIKVFWDEILETPIIIDHKDSRVNVDKNLRYIGTDLRPVFIEEKYLLYKIIPEVTEEVLNKAVWYSSANAYFS